MPYQSGGMDRDRRISRAGNPRARTTMIQLAWLWLRYQPGSELAEWFRERVGTLAGRTRRIAIVAMARKRALALRRDRGNTGWRRDPGGDNSRRIDRQELPPAAFAGGDTGNATVFFFGGTTPPRFRWVASRRGYASCMCTGIEHNGRHDIGGF